MVIVELAGAVATLLGIAGIGYKVGEKFGDLKEAKEARRGLADLQTLLSASRSEVAAFREESNAWKNRFQQSGTALISPIENIRDVINRPTSLWYKTPTERMALPSGKVVLLVANLKGGVGKTTLATNLAVEFGISGKRVLFLDLDFQGSGSSFLLRASGRLDVAENSRDLAAKYISHQTDAGLLRRNSVPLAAEIAPNVRVAPADSQLASEEEKLMLRWLIGDEPQDIRFNLTRNLSEIASDWDIVVIDAPPRLSTAMVQAVVAATHILIPTALEAKSTEAVRYFVEVIGSFKEKAVCSPKICGVVPNLLRSNVDYGEFRTDLVETVAPLVGSECLWFDEAMPLAVAFQREQLVQRQTRAQAGEAQEAIRKLATRVGRVIWQ